MEGTSSGGMGADGSTVVSSVDRSDGHEQFVIADISRDDRWLGIQNGEALPLDDWC